MDDFKISLESIKLNDPISDLTTFLTASIGGMRRYLRENDYDYNELNDFQVLRAIELLYTMQLIHLSGIDVEGDLEEFESLVDERLSELKTKVEDFINNKSNL